MDFGRAMMVVQALALSGCASLVSSAGSGLADSISTAMLNQDDPEIVRDGAPTFLMLLDGLVDKSPQDPALLGAAGELYASYGVVFVAEPERARKLTTRGRDYGQRALCATARETCGIASRPYDEFTAALTQLKPGDVSALYTFAFTWLAYIQAHSDDWKALAKLPEVGESLITVQKLDAEYRPVNVEHYLGVLNTIRPPALGGDFEAGKRHFEKAISLSEGRDLSIKVDYARYYARTLYDRELHDQLLDEVLKADPDQPGYVLTNTLAQSEALVLVESADDYF
jgi:hypothetical protein